MKLIAACSIAILAVTTVQARACETVRSYRAPTNFELVEQSDLIVLATVQPLAPQQSAGASATSVLPTITLSPLEILKGLPPQATLKVNGFTHRMWSSDPVYPTPTPLGSPHPSSFEGACTRTEYPVGGTLVAMFRKGPNGYVQLDHPFARQIEDVEGPDGLWVRAVKLYVELAQIPAGYKRRNAITEKMHALLADRSSPSNQQIGIDLKMYLEATHQLRRQRPSTAEYHLLEIWYGGKIPPPPGNWGHTPISRSHTVQPTAQSAK